MQHLQFVPRPLAPSTWVQKGARSIAVALLLLTLAACNASSPSLLLTVDDPEQVLPTQLRVSVTLESGDSSIVTRPGTPGEPLTPGQSLRILLPDEAVKSYVEVLVEGLIDGGVEGRTSARYLIPGEELEIRMPLAPIEECTEWNCPDGCCAGRRCLANSLDACGMGGESCGSCVPDRADVCVTGACRCGGEAQCSSGYRCVEGSCQAL